MNEYNSLTSKKKPNQGKGSLKDVLNDKEYKRFLVLEAKHAEYISKSKSQS